MAAPTDDVKVLAADLGARDDVLIGPTRHRPGFVEPPPRRLSYEEVKRIVETPLQAPESPIGETNA